MIRRVGFWIFVTFPLWVLAVGFVVAMNANPLPTGIVFQTPTPTPPVIRDYVPSDVMCTIHTMWIDEGEWC